LKNLTAPAARLAKVALGVFHETNREQRRVPQMLGLQSLVRTGSSHPSSAIVLSQSGLQEG